MQKIIVIWFKMIRFLVYSLYKPFDWVISYLIFYKNGVQFSTFKNHGWPKIHVGLGGICIIGPGFRSNNREMSNPIGRFNSCSIIVGSKGQLVIGSNVGMSSTAIVCQESVTIGDNVNLGGNVVIYDTDFHSLNAGYRLNRILDKENTITKPVVIGKNAFIGAHTTILKGVRIGENVVVGACSVVTKNIPDDEIWAGNPARMIRKLKATTEID